MIDPIEMLARKIQRTKGESLALSALLLGVLKAMNTDQRNVAIKEFDSQLRTLRSVLPNPPADEGTVKELDDFSRSIKQKISSLDRD